MKNNKKGITLIALIITIIVMLILVAVTILMAVNGGLFDYAGNATKETQKAIDEEKMLSSGISITEKLGDYQYGDSEQIRIVDYKNSKFLITGYKNSRIVLTPITFPNENEYMLSGKYKMVDGKKVSVNLDDPEATADESFDAFEKRMKDELDDVCQTRYGTNDKKIISYNSTESDEGIGPYLVNIDYRNKVQNTEELLAKDVEVLDCFFEEFNYQLPQEQISLMNDTNLDNAISFLYTGFENAITNQIEKYDFVIPSLDSLDMQEISINLKNLLKGNITFDEINTTKNISKNITILFYDYFKFYLFEGDNHYNVTTTLAHRDEWGYGYAWRMDIYDAIDSYMIFSPLREEHIEGENEDEFGTVTCKISPILLVDPSILQRTGQHTYTLNVY